MFLPGLLDHAVHHWKLGISEGAPLFRNGSVALRTLNLRELTNVGPVDGD